MGSQFGSPLDLLLNSESGGDILAFLRERGPKARIIGPARVRDLVFPAKRGSHRPEPIWSERPEDCIPSANERFNIIVIAEDAAQERAILTPLREYKGSKAYGLFSHILPALLCSVNGLAQGLSTRDIIRYAVLCIPRSGSRYLATTLSNRGIGAPKEHVRDPLALAIVKGKLEFRDTIKTLEKFGQRNGIFGTKLICTFAIRACHGRFSELKDNMAWMAERGYKFVHLDRALDDSVISSYIAYQIKKWHFFGEMNEAERARLDSLAFEDGAAWDEYVRYRAEKVIVTSLARWLGMPAIAYADVESDIDKVVSDLCSCIGVDPHALPDGAGNVPVPVPVPTRTTNSATYDMYKERMAALLDRRARDVNSATAARLREIAGLDRRAAQQLIEAGTGH